MKYFKLIENLSKNPNSLDFDFIMNYDDFEIQKISYDPNIIFENEIEIEVDLDCGKKELDYNLSNQGIEIVSEKLKSLFNENEAEFFKVKILNYKTKLNYYLLKIKNFYDCVDESKSEFEYYPQENESRKNEYKSLNRFYLDSTKVGKSRIFRLQKYFPEIIITEDLKKIFEENKITGLEYHTTWE